jgi:hypothetical protein
MMKKDAFDLWWAWVEKPPFSTMKISAEIHDAVMALPPQKRRDREGQWGGARGSQAWPATIGRECGPARRSGDSDSPSLIAAVFQSPSGQSLRLGPTVTRLSTEARLTPRAISSELAWVGPNTATATIKLTQRCYSRSGLAVGSKWRGSLRSPGGPPQVCKSACSRRSQSRRHRNKQQSNLRRQKGR